MDKILTAVYETMDYNKFRKLDCNRDVTELRKNKLKASISVKEIICPIIVNKKFEIVDGQGRYEAKRELGLPIYYVIDEDADIDDCRRMNTYNSCWTDIHYIESYAKAGNKNYIRLLETCDGTGLSISDAIRFCNKSKYIGHNGESILRKGDLIFTKIDKEKVLEILGKINDVKEALMFTGKLNGAFRTSIKVMAETKGYDHERFVRNCGKYRMRFTQTSRIEDQLKVFSEIYNMKLSNEKKIYFEDYMRNKGSNVRTYDEMSGIAKRNAKKVDTLSGQISIDESMEEMAQ